MSNNTLIQENIEFIQKEYNDVVFLVEATSCEQHEIWREWSKRLGYTQISQGNYVIIGYIDKRPISVSYSPNYYAGSKIIFFNATSQLVDHEMIRAFNEAAFPQLFNNVSRNKIVDAMNFHNCASELEKLLKENKETQMKFTELKKSGSYELDGLDDIVELSKDSRNYIQIVELVNKLRHK